MIRALLTIDDVSSKNTPAIVDYLAEKNIPVIMFAVGQWAQNYPDQLIYALKHGIIVGNHSYTHPNFSALSIEECKKEIDQNEEVLNSFYEKAGVERKYRPFRFPYGDKGGENREAFQKYFKENGFSKLKDTQITFEWWKTEGLSEKIDTLWTFDFAEYNIRPESGFTEEDVYKRINDEYPIYGGSLFKDDNSHILLLHAHDETDEMVPEYYKKFVGSLLDREVKFLTPEFF
jgi:peptidoglycan/xylan/chitin deacetylase (PgdA/CDA1 family)